MKQFMIDMMVLMMPYMKPIVFAGLIALVLSVVLTVTQIFAGTGGALAALAARIAALIGLFFIACEIAGRVLGMEPTLLFSADPFDRQMYVNQWPFWAVGAALLVAGLLVRRLCNATRMVRTA
jgi:hypothetical protein